VHGTRPGEAHKQAVGEAGGPFRIYRMVCQHLSMRSRALATGLAVLALAAGCSSTGSIGAAGQHGNIGASQITPAAAMRIFHRFLLRYRALNLKYSTALNDDITAGALNQQDAFGSKVGFTQFLFVAPGAPDGLHVYVPRLAGYPRWFMAIGTLNNDTETNSIYVLAQAQPGAQWKAVTALTDMPGLGPDQTPTLDSAGYANSVPAASTGLLAAPGQLASLYQRELDSGSGRLFDRLLGNTFALTPGGNSVSEARSGKLGWEVSIQWMRYAQPVYALATSAGRAIVIFALDQHFNWTAISAHPQLPPSSLPTVGQYFYAPWPQFARLAHVASLRKGLRISLETIYVWLAVDPPVHGLGEVLLPVDYDGFAGVSSNCGVSLRKTC
jgi:hypothetical protein